MKFKGKRLLVPVSVPCFDYKGKGENEKSVRKTYYCAHTQNKNGNGTVQISWDAIGAPSAKTNTTDTATQQNKANGLK